MKYEIQQKTTEKRLYRVSIVMICCSQNEGRCTLKTKTLFCEEKTNEN